MKGVYILMIEISKKIRITIGSLGSLIFSKGLYAYVGSAQKGLEKRVERHLRKKKTKFWHIDYLLSNKYVKVKKVFYKKAGKEEECNISKKLERKGNYVKNFGSSDCKCKSHLFRIKNIDLSRLRVREL
jgi:Uri superfamily endonuclease